MQLSGNRLLDDFLSGMKQTVAAGCWHQCQGRKWRSNGKRRRGVVRKGGGEGIVRIGDSEEVVEKGGSKRVIGSGGRGVVGKGDAEEVVGKGGSGGVVTKEGWRNSKKKRSSEGIVRDGGSERVIGKGGKVGKGGGESVVRKRGVKE